MADWATDPAYWRYQHVGPIDEAGVRRFIGEAVSSQSDESRRLFDFAVCLRDTAELIGTVRVAIVEPMHREAMLGYGFSKTHWGQGYGLEAVQKVLPFTFVALGVHRLTAVCDQDNEASYKLVQKLGFTLEGRLRGHRRVLGTGDDHNPVYSDSLIFGMLSDELI